MKIPCALLLVMAVSSPAFAQVSGETLAEAVASAMAGNPGLMAERSLRAVADERLEQARAGLRPSLGLNATAGTQGLEYGRTVATPSGSFPLDGWQERATIGLEARQTLYAGGSLAAQRNQARAGVDAAAAQLRAAEQDLILSVVTAFLDVRRAEQEVLIRETNVSSLAEQVRAARDRFDAGDVTRTDVAQAEARHAGSEAELAASRAGLAAARAAYEEIVGHAAVELASPPPAPALPGSLEAALAIARERNPQLAAARAGEEAAEEGVKVARGSLAPRLGLVGSAGLQETYQDKTFRDSNLGLVAELSIPFYQGGLLASRTRTARLERDQSRYGRMAVERSVASQVTSAWHAVIAAREAITASASRVDAAEVALEGARQELAVGTRITLDVLDQERELLDARLGLVEAERTAYLAMHQLLAAIGVLQAEMSGR